MEDRLHHVDVPALGDRRQEVATHDCTACSQALGCEERCGICHDGGQVDQYACDVRVLREDGRQQPPTAPAQVDDCGRGRKVVDLHDGCGTALGIRGRHAIEGLGGVG